LFELRILYDVTYKSSDKKLLYDNNAMLVLFRLEVHYSLIFKHFEFVVLLFFVL